MHPLVARHAPNSFERVMHSPPPSVSSTSLPSTDAESADAFYRWANRLRGIPRKPRRPYFPQP